MSSNISCVLRIYVLLSVGLCFGHAQEDAISTFKQANDLYKESKYQEAIDSYEGLVENGHVSIDLFANLGNAHLKENHIGASILNFEKALLLDPNNSQAKQNIVLAKELIINPVTHIPDFFVQVFWRKMVSQLSVSSWLFIHLFMLGVVLIMALLYWTNVRPSIAEKMKRHWSSLVLMGVLVLFSLLFLLCAHQRKEHLYGDNYGIIMEEGISLLDGPDDRSNEVTVLSEGLKGKILDQIDDWYKIQLDDKDEGWLNKSNIELIKIKA